MEISETILIMLMFLFFVGMFLLPFLMMRLLNRKGGSQPDRVEEKLDRIIELLEEQKTHK